MFFRPPFGLILLQAGADLAYADLRLQPVLPSFVTGG